MKDSNDSFLANFNLRTIPTEPGIYQMRNADGLLLYVGKASNLRQRLRSYFQKQQVHGKTRVLMQQVHDIQVTLTRNEVEALLLEANLIKQHKPRYNILLRDDKSYPFLVLSKQHSFPRLDVLRGVRSKAYRYFGPYPDGGAVRDTLGLLQKIFKIRQCSDVYFRSRSRPCLQYQIHRCTAPCVGLVSEQDYGQQIDNAVLFLEGKSEHLIESLQMKMDAAAKVQRYEQAALFRDQIIQLRHIQTQQCVSVAAGDVDVLGFAIEEGVFAIALLSVRAGQVLGHHCFFPEVPDVLEEAERAAAVLHAFLMQYYLNQPPLSLVVRDIVVPIRLPQEKEIEQLLSDALGHGVHLSQGQRGRFRQWLHMAEQNARQDLQRRHAKQSDYTEKWLGLQVALGGLHSPIARIECFDVSHFQGQATVASCIVFDANGPLPSHYRRYNLSDITPGDDYAGMRQTLQRRFKHADQQTLQLPDVVFIDGGKGQLQVAEDVIYREYQLHGILLLAIAKGPERKPGLEHLFRSDRSGERVELQAVPPMVLLLIQQIRDEAHRFAITGQRQRQHKMRARSFLEEIPGIGAQRRRALLRHFGGLTGLKAASAEAISKVPGIRLPLAQRIYEYLHGQPASQ